MNHFYEDPYDHEGLADVGYEVSPDQVQLEDVGYEVSPDQVQLEDVGYEVSPNQVQLEGIGEFEDGEDAFPQGLDYGPGERSAAGRRTWGEGYSAGGVTATISEDIFPPGADGAVVASVASGGLADFTDEFAAVLKTAVSDAQKGRVEQAKKGLAVAKSLYEAKFKAAGAALFAHYQAQMHAANAQVVAAEQRVRAGVLAPQVPSTVKVDPLAPLPQQGWSTGKKVVVVGLGLAGAGALGWWLWNRYFAEGASSSESVVIEEDEEVAV